MKTRILTFALIIASLFVVVPAFNMATASPIKAPFSEIKKVTAYSVPVTGTYLTNATFTIQKFTTKSGTLYAVGTLAGTLTDPVTGLTTQISQALTIPVT